MLWGRPWENVRYILNISCASEEPIIGHSAWIRESYEGARAGCGLWVVID